MTFLGEADAWLAGQLADHAGRPIAYWQGGVLIEGVTAVGHPHQAEHESEHDSFEHRWHRRTYTLPHPQQLVDGERQIVPRPGDRIEDEVDGRKMSFEVLPQGDSQPAYRVVGTEGRMWQLQTKRVE